MSQPTSLRHVSNLLHLFYTVPLCILIHFISGISIMTHVSLRPLSLSLRLYLSHCLYVCLPRSLGNGPRALCAAMNDSSPGVAYVLGLENKRLAGCLQEGWRRGDRGDAVARRGRLQSVVQKSTTGKNVVKRVFLRIVFHFGELFLALGVFAINYKRCVWVNIFFWGVGRVQHCAHFKSLTKPLSTYFI